MSIVQAAYDSLLGQISAQKSAIKKAASSSAAVIEEQKEERKKKADRDVHAATLQNAFNVRGLPQFLEARGQTGGRSESAYLQQQALLENNSNSINNVLSSDLKDYDAQIAQIWSEANQRMAELDVQGALAWMNLASSMQSQSSGSTARRSYGGRGGDLSGANRPTYQRAYTGTTTTDPAVANQAWVDYYKPRR